MDDKTSAKRFVIPPNENGGRVALLFLLFLVALYAFYSMGLTGMAMVCAIPVTVIYIFIAFRFKMFTFWTLFVLNYFITFLSRYGYLPIPISIVNELFEIILLAIAIIDAKMFIEARFLNVMLIALLTWCGFCTLEVFNDVCGLGIDIGAWYTGARLMAFQLMYAFLVCTIYISNPRKIRQFVFAWACLSIFAALWAWKQKNLGFTSAEKAFLVYAARTHMVNGVVRYFSVFSDAANFGCNMAASAVCFYVVGLTSRIRKDKIFFLLAGVACTWAMFSSGTRTAIFCMIAGFMVYIVLSKSFKIAVPLAVVFGLLVFMLAFTTIGNGNSMIRRMRSAFNKNDASAGVRDINKTAIKKYIVDAPFGIGIGIGYENVPANNKFRKLSTIPPDSEYVFIWVHTGTVGITVFVIITCIMLLGACWIVFFQLKNNSLRGIGGALCSAFTAIQLGGYGNQILMQFPNVLLFYGGLSLVFLLPSIEQAYTEEENKRYALQEERKRLREEKKRVPKH